MQDITISRATIKEIAQRIYDEVDTNGFSDEGYSLKDLELAVTATLTKIVHHVTTGFEGYALGPYELQIGQWNFQPRRHCDATGCEMLVRADNDIWCHRHGEIEDAHQAEVEAAMAMQYDDLAF